MSTAELYFTAVMRGKEGFLASCLRFVMWICSFGYQAVLALHGLAYRLSLLKTQKVPLPVICIGNIVAGGTGKTPLTALIAQKLVVPKVAILLRGYRRKKKNQEPLLVTASTSVEEAGDEALLLARSLPNAMVIVGKNRFEGAKLAHEKGADLILLDDGLQHRRLFKDVNMVVVDALDPFGQGYFLPRGFLRSSPKVLAKASLVVVNGGPIDLGNYTHAPIVQVETETVGLFDWQGNLISQLIGNQYVAIFCGIGQPNRFCQTVEKMGAKVVAKLYLADHKSPSQEEFRLFQERAKKAGAKWLLCTEKDWVKGSDLKSEIPLAFLRIHLKVKSGHEALERALWIKK